MAVISAAKNIMSDVFSSALPLLVTSTVASGYIAAISIAQIW